MSFLIAVTVAIVSGGIVALMGNENPFEVYQVMLVGSLGSWDGLGYSLFFATPFIFTGLAVMLPYRVGLFNIGGEGQLYMGAVGLLMAEKFLPPLGFMTIPAFMLCSFLTAGIWAGLAGALKAWRGCHEVITTIMLNFIAVSFTSYAILYWWKNPISQSPETEMIRTAAWVPKLNIGDSPLNLCFVFAVGAAFLLWFLLAKTSLGFRWRASGMNASAARMAGYSVKRNILASMMLAGAFAAGAAMNEILGNSHRLVDGFSSGYGFVGIAVAFLGRNHPIGVVLAGIFFGALFKGASDLEIETTHMTRDFSIVLQALMIAAVASEQGIARFIQNLKNYKKRRLHASGK